MTPLFLFAPGAGAPSSHPWMQRWKERLAAFGSVRTFDYDYIRSGRRRPDPLPQLIAAHRQALTEARSLKDQPAFLIGKSMGGRIGCHVALEEQVNGVICMGYPLCGGGDSSKLRDQVLRDLQTPALFIQGTRDPLCPLPMLETVRAGMKTTNFLHIVEGGDHSLMLSKRQLLASGETQNDLDKKIEEAIRAFIDRLTSA